MEELNIKAGLFRRVFGANFRQVYVNSSGLRLSRKRGEQILHSWDQLTSAPECEHHLLTSSIHLTTRDGNIDLLGLRKSQASALRGHALVGFYEVHERTVKAILSKIQTEYRKVGYLRSSHCKKISEYAIKALSKIPFPTEEIEPHLPDSTVNSFRELKSWSRRDSAFIDGIRREYIAKEKERFKEFFDMIESNPLTEKQRDACIIDEQNNLVLAGAGTGKTSTMVGRVGYLLESKQAVGHEILMLAFGNKAAQEMRDRIEEKLSIKSVDAFTFHALGKMIITEVEGVKPSISPLAEDEKLLKRYVDSWFSELLEQKAYKETALEYFENYLFPEANPFDFKSEGEYFEYIKANEIRSLKGEQVKSFEECVIANWLFMMGIEYEYEPSYKESDTRTPEFRQYRPDFYLSEYGLYLEHFGIDRDGNTAPYVDKKTYHEGMAWKRQLHAEHGTELLETYHYEQTEGCLLSNLEDKLVNLGVQFRPLPADAMLSSLRDFGAISKFSVLLADLLKRYRANCYTPRDLSKLVAVTDDNGRLSAAIELLLPVVQRYESALELNDEIDFEDMISKAIQYVEDGSFVSNWTYILVDEFQDISEPRARLVKALRKSRSNTSVFCVGDDWQAIYRFAGSDVSLTTGFEASFGPTVTTSLDKTFRFNNSISDVASKFVMKNPSQVKKQITTHAQVDTPAVSLVRKSIRKDQYYSHVLEILRRIEVIAEPGAKVYLLARYHFRLLEQYELRRIRDEVPSLNVEQLTFHASKGKEADYVVVVGLDNSKNGFPSRRLTHPLLESLLPKNEPYPDAEERRLFYVAITRAKHRAYLLADMTKASDFIKEIIKDKYPVELNEFETELNQATAAHRKCPACETGTVLRREGMHGAFMSCSNFPLCNHKESVCPRCKHDMKHNGNHRLCVNEECGWWIPSCPDCGSDLKQRQGRFGNFWGCINFRSQGESCNYTTQYINILDR